MSDSRSSNSGNEPHSYQVKRITSSGQISEGSLNRRQLLDATGLLAEDVRLVVLISDSLPSDMLEVRTEAILFNLGPLHAIVKPNCLYIFHHTGDHSECCGAFGNLLKSGAFERLLESNVATPLDSFLLKVITSAFFTLIDHMESQVKDLQSHVTRITHILPKWLSVGAVEELSRSVNMLKGLESKAKGLNRCLGRILEDPLRLYGILSLERGRLLSAKEKDRIEELFEGISTRFSRCHLNAKHLLGVIADTKETNDNNLSVWRDKVTKGNLCFAMMTFVIAFAAMFPCIFGMNFETTEPIFWGVAGGILLTAAVVLVVMFYCFNKKNIL